MAYDAWLDKFVGNADEHDDCDDPIVLVINENGYDVEFSIIEREDFEHQDMVYAYVGYDKPNGRRMADRTDNYTKWSELTNHLMQKYGIRNLCDELYEALEEGGY